MSEANKYEGHTPGPWRDVEYNGRIVGLVMPLNGVSPLDGRPIDAEICANKALIADAPELLRQRDALLAALEKIRRQYLADGDADQMAMTADDAVQAIAATKGGA